VLRLSKVLAKYSLPSFFNFFYGRSLQLRLTQQTIIAPVKHPFAATAATATTWSALV